MSDSLPLDDYSRRARLAPIMIMAVPALLGLAAWIPNVADAWKTLGGLGMTGVATFLLAQFGRDMGKSRQEALFASWGGRPTTRFLRHRDPTIDAVTKGRYRKVLEPHLSGLTWPTPEQEQTDPDSADAVYASCARYLREATRAGDAFRLVREANVDYGFRRNLWGLRPFGIASSALGLALAAANVPYFMSHHVQAVPLTALAAFLLSAGLLLIWAFRITPTWVKLTADDYAEKLLASCETLGAPKP